MPPKSSPAILGYVLSGVIAVPMAIIILRAEFASGIRCIGANAHCPNDGASKWMMLTAGLAIAVDIALVLNLLMEKVRGWLRERPVKVTGDSNLVGRE